jgi:RND family efflux transporter MFP subunit
MSFFKRNLKKIIIALITAAIIVVIFVVKIQSAPKSATIFDPKTETLVQAKRQTIKDQITLAGSVDATLKADLNFQTSGQLDWVGVKVGDKVKKYQAIASLNRDQLKKQLQMDFNNYRSSLATFDDTQATYKPEKDSLTLTDDMKRILVRAQNTLDNSVINYELGDLAIKYSILTTPIAGIITNIEQPSSGININPSNATFSVVDPNSIYFTSKIDQEDVPKVKVGDITTITLDSFPGQTFESKVNYIAFTPVVGESNTVYEIRFELPTTNNDLQYRLGMDGDAIISIKQEDNTLTIPIDTLNQDGNQVYVLVKDPNSSNLTKKYIQTGIETDTTVEILGGLSENDQIVLNK